MPDRSNSDPGPGPDGSHRLVDPGELQRLDPAVVLRPGRADPATLLVLWFLRRSFLPLLLVGFTLLTVMGRLGDDPTMNLTNPASVARALLTPWVGVAAAIVVRVVANVGALLLAAPLTRWARPDDYRVGRSSGRVRAWSDRWQRTAAYRALRWTWPVRRLAAERLGRTGYWLLALDRGWMAAVVVTVLVWIAAVLTVGAPQPSG